MLNTILILQYFHCFIDVLRCEPKLWISQDELLVDAIVKCVLKAFSQVIVKDDKVWNMLESFKPKYQCFRLPEPSVFRQHSCNFSI